VSAANRITVAVQGVGVLGPGLANWPQFLELLRASQGASATSATTVLPTPMRLPPAERRRAGAAIKVAMAVADEAVVHGGLDPQSLATVFTASNGEGSNCHNLCETLASAERAVSPTRFTNSVHNAAAGYWHIAVASRAASTSLCGFDASFGAGLLEAVTQVAATQQAVLLVASDTPYPEPLHAKRPLRDNFGLALLLTPHAPGAAPPTPQPPAPALLTSHAQRPALAWLRLSLHGGPHETPATACHSRAFEALRRALPAAAGLALLEAIARVVPGAAQSERVRVDCPPALHLQIDVTAAAP
jgi:Beta-ketoacyl synthase, N-terminal domain